MGRLVSIISLVSIVSESCPSLRVLLRDYTTSSFVKVRFKLYSRRGTWRRTGRCAGRGWTGCWTRPPGRAATCPSPRWSSVCITLYSLCLSLSLPHNLCPASLRKIKINDESFVSALRDVKAEFLITSLHVVGWKERDIFLSISSSVSIREFCCVQVSVQVHYKSYVSIIYNLSTSIQYTCSTIQFLLYFNFK